MPPGTEKCLEFSAVVLFRGFEKVRYGSWLQFEIAAITPMLFVLNMCSLEKLSD